ncbi:uncharacterized protein N7483_002501 [Penicillium malachiteum]|uniref:uncharacterized protein n=1 Tax=Penicillium malachiteum TaxID=1324776 RepID=UPI002546FB59|nr:uncharacterized protein N7483_002398 [Penicillium malachiteum]XP_056952087.1 uncharacterized protein N7483_002501 [Penicillium malachiteum]KAJ5737273.1 hypothetical protein N7483_002398 [Penicillium malachiteum]KAJ5737376.1 hypothetical protein N7483_002501 [Penicillium malachiteum]
MRRAFFTEDEVKQSDERRLKYQGTARVKISEIEFGASNSSGLCDVFRKSRCRRFELSNYVPATLSQEALTEALNRAGTPARSLLLSSGKDIPFLSFSKGQLQGLYGRHRLHAGFKVLAPAERWWTVDLYLHDISDALRTSIVEEYSNEKGSIDREIYRKLRQYESEGNELLCQKWLTRLSDCKRKHPAVDKGI